MDIAIRFSKKKSGLVDPKKFWDGKYESVREFKTYLKGHFMQVGVGYFTHPDFAHAYCHCTSSHVLAHFPGIAATLSQAQLEFDVNYVYGAMMTLLRFHGSSFVKQYESTQDGFTCWYHFLHHYDHSGDKNMARYKHEQTLATRFAEYDGPLAQFVMGISAATITTQTKLYIQKLRQVKSRRYPKLTLLLLLVPAT